MNPTHEERRPREDGAAPQETSDSKFTTGRRITEGMMTSDSFEWYTPRDLLVRVARALGGTIDLDPCSDAAHNVPARLHYTAADGGLAHEWRGTVFVNPPYGNHIGDWLSKLRDEYRAKRVTRGIALVPARTDTQWWHQNVPKWVCFLEGRLKFTTPSGKRGTAPFPSAVWFWGDGYAAADFVEEFCPKGQIWRRYL